ncbi:MAG: fumarate hydratase [Myxococcales bacterium]|nr:fumarate hydratase [Myxococcales bacterium]
MLMKKHFLELIRRTSSQIPPDVLSALEAARDAEAAGSPARSVLEDVLKNCALAAESSRPVCQDTGTAIWMVYHPPGVSPRALERDILWATREATRRSYLRPNAVDAITGKNSGDNTGLGLPVLHFHEWGKKSLHADLLLKGGGSENVSAQYSLPDSALKAGRDLEGVRRVVIDGIFKAQGQGCGPGIIGVGVGGDRATSMLEAKEQLFRLLTDRNPDPALDGLERRLVNELNRLGVGPMGFGGATTVLGVKIGKRHRLPASFFVSLAYMCWACRRGSVSIVGERARFDHMSQIAARYRPDAERKRAS